MNLCLDVFDFGQSKFEVSLLSVWSNTIDVCFALGVAEVVTFVGEEGRCHDLMDIVLVRMDGLFLFHEFSLEELAIIFLLFDCRGFLYGLRLAMDDLVDGHVGVLVFRLRFCLLSRVELISLTEFRDVSGGVRIDAYVVFKSYLHMIHSAIEVTDVTYFFLLTFDVS